MAVNPHLQAHFPHMFPKKPTIENIKNDRPKYVVRGGRGIDDLDSPTFCEVQYLSSLTFKMKNILLKIEMFRHDAPKVKSRPTDHGRFNPRTVLQEALREFADLSKQFKRLADNPILFGHAFTALRFFPAAGRIFKHTAVSIRKALEKPEMREEAATHETTSSEIHQPPWYTSINWTQQANSIPLSKQEIKDLKPGDETIPHQVLPAQGVLIHEHWRRELSETAQAIANVSRRPELVHRPPPAGKSLWRSQEAWSGSVRVIRLTKPEQMPANNEQNARVYHFGETEIGRSAGFMARLFRKETTVGGNVALVRAVFKAEMEDGMSE